MNKTYRQLQLLMLATSPMWLETVGLGDTINHGDLGLGSRVSETSEIPGCDPFPEDPGAIPTMVSTMIPTLRTGWARMMNGQLHVLLSDASLGCPDAPNSSDSFVDVPACGTEAWTLHYDLPEEMQAVGTYQLSEHVVNWELLQQSAGDAGVGCSSGCASTTLGSSFTPGGQGPEAQLELFSINDQCITGRIIGLDLSNQIVPPRPQLNGAFRAVRCD
jgi:hypothetical protein